MARAVKKQNGHSNLKFSGYRRENGRVGIRNHVVILPLDDLSNAACEAVANNIKGTLAIPHAYGRLQFGEDLETFFRTLIGTGSNPNVAAVVVIGIEDQWTKRVVDGIKKTGKPVTGFGIEGTGDIMTVAKASRAAKDYLQWASELKKEECDISELTGGEHLAKARAINSKVGEKWYKVWKSYEDEVIQAHKTDDLSDSQPTKGNIVG